MNTTEQPAQPRALYAWSLFALAAAVERYELEQCDAARNRLALERLYWINPVIVAQVAPHVAEILRAKTWGEAMRVRTVSGGLLAETTRVLP